MGEEESGRQGAKKQANTAHAKKRSQHAKTG
jgi:hypothetical protein